MAVLILYASAGNGHRRAAQGLYEAFIASGRSDVVMMDILDFTPLWFKQIYSSGYMKVINKAKWLWRFLFDLTNRPSHSIFVDSWHGLLNIMAAKSLGEYIRQANIDLVVTTHFMANDVVTYYRKKFSCRCRLVCVVTDYVVHRFWYSKGVDKVVINGEDAILYKGMIVTGRELEDILTKQLKQNPNMEVLIKADRLSSLGRTVAVWDICRKIGVKRVSIAARQVGEQ